MQWLRVGPNRMEAVERPIEFGCVMCPEPTEGRHALLQCPIAISPRNRAAVGQFKVIPTDPNSEKKAATRDVIERGDTLGEVKDVMFEWQRDGCSETKRGALRGS